jgi:hypothetical protein
MKLKMKEECRKRRFALSLDGLSNGVPMKNDANDL